MERADPNSQRRDFVEEYLRRLTSMTALCACYGISRRVGYKWLARYLADGDRSLTDRSRRPHSSPGALAPDLAEPLLNARLPHPSWGPRKILACISRRHPRATWPAPSTVASLFKTHGLVRPRRRRVKPGHPGRPTTPIDVWTADFKGHFALRQGPRCHPLTIVDSFSRFLLGCQALPHPSTVESQPVFRRLFQEYGLPERLRTYDGAPFATTTLCRPSGLRSGG